MSEELRSQIYSNMNLKETDELLEIWQTNDRDEWSDLAFDVVRQILLSRISELPEQDEPVLEEESEDKADDDEEEEDLVCPRCKSTTLVKGEINSNGQNLYFADQELIGVACQDCGFVFIMLTDFIE